MVDDPSAPLRLRLADELANRGIVGAEWRPAVERVPRHVLVPRFHHRPEDEGGGQPPHLIDGSRPEQRERYLQLVYSPDETLVTEIDGETGYPTSSSTMPSIVLAMLGALDAQPTQTVLEIGTGSGYSTALLCERLGDENVTSVDAGAAVLDLARKRLKDAGYRPTLVCTDGYHGCPHRAPYDRVISTCRSGRIPTAWVEQAATGGVILAVMPDCLVRLVASDDGSASGHLTAHEFGFMWMRGHSPTRVPVGDLAQGDGPTRRCRVDMWALLEGRVNGAFWPLAQLLHAPFLQRVRLAPRQLAYVAMDDRSWFRLDVEKAQVTQGGTRCLWDAFEALYQRLDEAGRPSRERFGLTVQPDGAHLIWLDRPGPHHTWAVLEPAGQV
ncbi:MAG: protein-L-isoaspartate(D-aspartate) O-methyltransferase [Chloroflexi bacterium]|jgi:protein-L-isoaspartate O-methyltransferase|nr:protein-L-isoaspartate(D-aspartate) O-methyltransferase [Chloroflexota bacterium]